MLSEAKIKLKDQLEKCAEQIEAWAKKPPAERRGPVIDLKKLRKEAGLDET